MIWLVSIQRIHGVRRGRRSLLTLPFAATVVAGGCGVQPECLEDARSLSLDESNEFGQSLQGLIDATTQDGMMALTWNATNGPLDFDGEGSNTEVTWSLSLGEASAKFVNAQQNPDNMNTAYFACPDRIEVEGVLEVSTADGWLDEQDLEVTVRFQGRDDYREVSADNPVIAAWSLPQQSVEISSLQGSLPSGLSSSGGTDYLLIESTDKLGDDVVLSVETMSVIESGDTVSVGHGVLGCGSMSGSGCAEPGFPAPGSFGFSQWNNVGR